jgi:S1-C subfamily serine protease
MRVIKVGQTVLAIGNPFGLDYTLTTGVVSALNREIMGVGGRPIKGCVQVQALILLS